MIRASAASLLLVCASGGCNETSKSAGPGDASSDRGSTSVPPPAALGEGCARTGSLEAVESDPSCVMPVVRAALIRDAMKRVTMTVTPDRPTVAGGATMFLRVVVANTSSTEALVVFEAHPASAGPRPDWARLRNVPELRAAPSDGYHLPLRIRTVDSRDRDVDALPPMSGTPGTPKLLGVRLRPGGKLTHGIAWWALRIPAPAPIFHDDAGHRVVPKTAPTALAAGEYVVNVELPIHGWSPAERIVSTRITVEPPP